MPANKKFNLGVNIDHVATLRQARLVSYPDPAVAALLAEKAGCSSVVAHLRKDRRHIQDEDIFLINQLTRVPFNLEMSTAPEIVEIALKLKPKQATLVPENRNELTTEGGIDLSKNYKKVSRVVEKLKKEGVFVSLFVDPVKKQIKLSQDIGAGAVEINTGRFSELKEKDKQKRELERIRKAAIFAEEKGFMVAAGHGLDYRNIEEIKTVSQIKEFNIGHSIICRALFVGLVSAVKEMVFLLAG